jgi:hypothetical protein
VTGPCGGWSPSTGSVAQRLRPTCRPPSQRQLVLTACSANYRRASQDALPSP